jgi:hypothetical protein
MASYAKFDVWQNTAGVNRQTVLQVVQTVKTDTFSTTSTTWTDITGFNATITPSSTTSKILVQLSLCFLGDANTQGFARLMRDSTPIAIGDAYGSRTRFTLNNYQLQINQVPTTGVMFVDSPATTSAVTYKVQLQNQNTGANVVYVNRSPTWTDAATSGTGVSTLVLMEIAQ